MPHLHRYAATLTLGWFAAPVLALNIVLTNDDGFETANIQALYRALQKAEHDVILSAPYTGQSGTSGQMAFLKPITSTRTPSGSGHLRAGSLGIGETTLGPQQYYVDGSPAAAVLYGIDVKAPELWDGKPDLVISGPNEGNNLGVLIVHSGTIGATVTALNKGIPAIAVSAENGDPKQAEVVAKVVVTLVDTLTGNKEAPRKDLGLPSGVGLNVNLPKIDPETTTAADFEFQFTRIGTSANLGPMFYEDISQSALAVGYGIPENLGLPGVSIVTPASDAGYTKDDAVNSESNALQTKTVTVSAIQGTYAIDQRRERKVKKGLRSLLRKRR